MMEHDLYKTGEKDAPNGILDRNNEVVLSECKVCGGAEAALPANCPGRRLTSDELDQIMAGSLDFK